MAPYCPTRTWRSPVCCQHNTPTSPMAEQELMPITLINRTGCGSLSHSPSPCLRVNEQIDYPVVIVFLPWGLIHTQKCHCYTRAFNSAGYFYCWVIEMACRIFLEGSKLVLVIAGLTLSLSDWNEKNNRAVFSLLLQCNGELKDTESLYPQRHRPASVQKDIQAVERRS